MILIPGVAVCWNLLPKSRQELPSFAAGMSAEESAMTAEPEDMPELLPSIPMEPPVVQALPPRTESGIGSFPMTLASPNVIKAMNWTEENEAQTIPIPTVVAATAVVPAIPTASGADLSPQQHFPRLASELQSLGVTYSRLEKWGDRGELYRFRCYVAVEEPYRCHKYFQDIDRDEIRVMERVIAQIKAWRK